MLLSVSLAVVVVVVAVAVAVMFVVVMFSAEVPSICAGATVPVAVAEVEVAGMAVEREGCDGDPIDSCASAVAVAVAGFVSSDDDGNVVAGKVFGEIEFFSGAVMVSWSLG